MTTFLLQYLPILIFFGVAAVIGVAFLLAAYVMAPKHPDPEKISAYECGFNAFDVRFYLVSILFIIFDLEGAFLFPWAVALMRLPKPVQIYSFWSMISFIVILSVGFLYEWKKGALEWE